jgi:hypothetical protein
MTLKRRMRELEHKVDRAAEADAEPELMLPEAEVTELIQRAMVRLARRYPRAQWEEQGVELEYLPPEMLAPGYVPEGLS